jgi:signal peptidase I
MHPKLKSILKSALYWLIVLLATILLTIVLRVFFIASFQISGTSMYPVIETGDKVVVNKQIPGPRIIDYGDPEAGIKPNIKRIKGIRPIRRNDVLVLNKPFNRTKTFTPDWNVHYIKRCVAIPGDTFYIENGIYKVKNVADTLGNCQNQRRFGMGSEKTIPGNIFHCYPKRNPHYGWTVLHFGPLYIPRRGDSLAIDTLNIALYKDMIEYESGEKISVADSQVRLGERPLNRYTFHLNYYFLTGDYVSDSVDSRYWGPLPEDHIVGKAAYAWNRGLKPLR